MCFLLLCAKHYNQNFYRYFSLGLKILPCRRKKFKKVKFVIKKIKEKLRILHSQILRNRFDLSKMVLRIMIKTIILYSLVVREMYTLWFQMSPSLNSTEKCGSAFMILSHFIDSSNFRYNEIGSRFFKNQNSDMTKDSWNRCHVFP